MNDVIMDVQRALLEFMICEYRPRPMLNFKMLSSFTLGIVGV
jgi:hypothetical protein